MRTRFNIIVVAFLSVLALLMLALVNDRKSAAPTPPPLAVAVPDRTQTDAVAQPAPAASVAVAPVVPVSAVAPPVAAVEILDDKSKYTAQWGDTVSNLAAELPGGDRKANRDAVINANPSLQRDPDRLLAGTTYTIPTDATVATNATATVPATVATPVPTTVPVTAAPAASDDRTHELKYVARTGDNVSVLAGALLGSDTKENRDAIVAANASLRADPDRLVDGQTYRIPVSEGQPLAAADAATPGQAQTTAARVGAQPDADDVVEAGSARELRYTARPGDTVSALAVALLGSDTKENRAAIVDNNKSLVNDPDHVVAGQTYWITAPTPSKP